MSKDDWDRIDYAWFKLQWREDLRKKFSRLSRHNQVDLLYDWVFTLKREMLELQIEVEHLKKRIRKRDDKI